MNSTDLSLFNSFLVQLECIQGAVNAKGNHTIKVVPVYTAAGQRCFIDKPETDETSHKNPLVNIH